MFERPSYQKRYDWGFYQWRGDLGGCPIPEPSTIGFLGLGALVVLGFKKYRNDKKKS